jgi:ABC-type nitrate/sulfonate/bicarbonate transport system permease component
LAGSQRWPVPTGSATGTPGRCAVTVAVDLRTSAHGVVLRRAGRSLLTIVIAVVVLGVLWTVAMLLRSVPLVAMAPLLLLVFGQGELGSR